MSAAEHSIVLSIKKVELPDGTTLDDGITCYLYLNSSPFSVSKVSDSNNSTLVSAKSLDDSLQLVFRGKEQDGSIGSVSFRMNYFAQTNSNRFTRWITLFDDPVCDSFAGNIGEDKSRPRALIDFEILKEDSVPARSESNSLVSFELYLKEKEQNGLVLPQIKEELEISDMKDSIDDQNYISVGGISVEAHHETKVHPISNFSPLRGVSDEVSNVKPTVASEENQSPSRAKQQPQEGLVEALSSQDLNRNQNHRQSLEARKESKECFSSGKSSNREEGESLFYLEQQNGMLNNRINELNQKIQDLEVKNMSLKESEEASEGKLHHLRIQFEKLRFKTENYETLVTETEQELSETKDQLTAEIAAKTQLLGEKETLSVSLQQIKEAYEELKKAKEEKTIVVEKKESPEDYIAQQQAEVAQATEQIKQSFEQLIEQREKIQNDEKEALKVQANQLREEVQRLKAIIQEDAGVIQNLQKEVSTLRQREDETAALGLPEKLKEAEDQIKFYEEKTKSMIEVCTAYLFKGVNQFESIDDLIIRVQKEINNTKQEMQELKTVNEALELKLSICDNKLLADTLWGQINDFKQQVTSLEKERESQKNELFKVNENYSKLINKYTELTEVLANLQQPVQKVQAQKPAQKTTPTMGNLSKTIYSKLNTRTVETPDEIESKLAEFTASNKISPAFLTKVDKGQYLYNGRKITLKVISGRLMVKGVAGYKPLQDFIKAENGTRTPPRTTKEYPKTERKSFDANSKRDRLELNPQIADHMRRDLTPDSVRSMSFSTKEHLKDFTPKDFDTRPLLTEPSQSETKIRPLLPEQVRVKDLIASRSVERKISYNIARSGQKRESLF